MLREAEIVCLCSGDFEKSVISRGGRRKIWLQIQGPDYMSNHACRAARRMNQARKRTAGNTLLMRIASNL